MFYRSITSCSTIWTTKVDTRSNFLIKNGCHGNLGFFSGPCVTRVEAFLEQCTLFKAFLEQCNLCVATITAKLSTTLHIWTNGRFIIFLCRSESIINSVSCKGMKESCLNCLLTLLILTHCALLEFLHSPNTICHGTVCLNCIGGNVWSVRCTSPLNHALRIIPPGVGYGLVNRYMEETFKN